MRKYIPLVILLGLFFNIQAQNEIFKIHKKLSTWGLQNIPVNVDFNSISISNDEKFIAAAGAAGSFIIWNINTGEIHKNLTDTTKDFLFLIRSLKSSNDSKYLAAVGSSIYLKFRLVNIDNKTTYEPVGKAVAKKVIRIYDAANFNLIKEIKYDTIADILSCTFTPDSKYLLTGEYISPVSSESRIRVWDTKTWNQVSSVNCIGMLWDLTFNSGGDKLYSATSTNFISVWNFSNKNLTPLPQIKLVTKEIDNISISSDDKFFSVNQDTIRIYKFDSINKFSQLSIYSYGLFCASFSKDGKYIISGQDHNNCNIWDAKTFSLLQSLQGDINIPLQNEDGNNYTRPIFSPKSKYIAMTNDAGMIYIFKRKEN